MAKRQQPQQSQTDINAELLSKLNSLKKSIKEKKTSKSSSSDLFHYEPPVSPKEFIESEKYIGNKSRGFIRPWVIETMETIFSRGPYYFPKYQTAAIICGKGSGKSYLVALMNTYIWYQILCFKNFIQYLNDTELTTLDPSTSIMLVGMAKHKDQAKEIVFDNTKKFISQVKAFRERNWLPKQDVVTQLLYEEANDYGEKFKKLAIVPGNSSETFALGFAVYGGVIDEAGFFKERTKDPVEEIYNELNTRRFSRFGRNGLVTLISSARTEDVFIEKLFSDAEKDDSIFALRKATYDCDPKYFHLPRFQMSVNYETSDGTIRKAEINPPEILKTIYENDQYSALRDINGIPSLVGKPFYPDFVLLTSRINKDRNDPCPDLGADTPEGPMDIMARLDDTFRGVYGFNYRIHVDLAKGNLVKGQCGVGFAMAHKIANPEMGYKIKLDLAIRFKAPPSKEIQVDEILALIRWLKDSRGFNIDLVTFDKWNSLSPKQTILSWKNGVDSDELSVDYKHHTFFKTAALTGQLDWYEDKNLLHELKRLEDYITFVDCSTNSYKDEADAAAGAVYSAAALEPALEIVKPRVARGITLGTLSGGGQRTMRPPGLYRQGGDTNNNRQQLNKPGFQ